jgi:adenine deaminase
MMTGCNMLTEMNLLKKAGLSNKEILLMATKNFADFYNENYGIIAEGKDADFIVLNDSPIENLETLSNIEGLFFNNNYLSKTELNNLRQKLIFHLPCTKQNRNSRAKKNTRRSCYKGVFRKLCLATPSFF